MYFTPQILNTANCLFFCLSICFVSTDWICNIYNLTFHIVSFIKHYDDVK